ncbi:replication protein [Massilia sp. CFBP9026]|uniref:replication protein n=1 Tax=Massilia sp. CFBP9026 TaxID=3096536 RepID=UPI002A698E68|nr:replication protein [Massilia sp. CFBP9026]MDY0961765.1 replication protein [Massilia sp. CFBP9026]
MSTPQLEDGFVRIANELLEALLAARLTANQWKVVMTIIRKTYGYGKKEDDLSASQIASICAMNRTHVTEVLNQLARMNIINKRPGMHGSLVSIQKDSRTWIADAKIDDGTPKRIIVKTADRHYVYRVTLPATGEFYLGVRSCKCHPNQDRYVGSGNWISTIEKSQLIKEVIQIFDSRQDAERAEVSLIRQHAGNGLLRNSTCYLNGTAFGDDLSTSCPTRTDSVQGVQESHSARTDSVQVDRTDFVHTKDNLPKDNHQKKNPCAPQADRDQVGETPAGRKGRAKTGLAGDLADRFERFYAAYPKKRSRGVAEKAFAQLNPSEELLADMLASLALQVASGGWVDPQFVPHPASWLNAKGWLDEVQAAYSADELAVIDAFNRALGAQLGDVSATLFVPARAAAIREFVTFSQKPGFVERYFPWVRDNASIPPHAKFDWIISRKGFADVTSGQHDRKAA